MKREASYSDVYQVHPAVGPGGYVREALYRHQGTTADAVQSREYKMCGRLPEDTRPGWRVAW